MIYLLAHVNRSQNNGFQEQLKVAQVRIGDLQRSVKQFRALTQELKAQMVCSERIVSLMGVRLMSAFVACFSLPMGMPARPLVRVM